MSSDVVLVGSLISKDFNLDADEFPIADNLAELRSALKKIISYFLDKDLERLLQALYRIDIDESKVKKILAQSEPSSIAADISELIIERELQKVETRKKYSQ